ncbi:unnamed protein product [Mycena citricolor]|uniref:Kinase n=1 Tax=Mycena citricolor TaxID=2018698 RepID=A0AAD2HXG7_9AGAR|nr:unnamed protein product [Mycena citricolor]
MTRGVECSTQPHLSVCGNSDTYRYDCFPIMSTSSPRTTPSPTPTHAFQFQVGGHAGNMMSTDDDALIIKKALPRELEFYETVAASTDPQVDALRPFIPTFLGTLSLADDVDVSQVAAEPKKESLVLENIVYPFVKPNILDIKLGTVFWDEDTPPAKKARMIKTAETTTSLETGARLVGFQVFDHERGEPVFTPKTYGKSITPAQLPEGMARFFPVATEEAPNQGLPPALLLQILTLLREEIEDLRDAFSAMEMRMIAGSLLIVYESDAERAEAGIRWLEEEDDDEGDEDEEGEDGTDEPGGFDNKRKQGPPCDARLIDFAHTKFVPGQGPDDGVLLGLNTVLRLLDGRMTEIQE